MKYEQIGNVTAISDSMSAHLTRRGNENLINQISIGERKVHLLLYTLPAAIDPCAGQTAMRAWRHISRHVPGSTFRSSKLGCEFLLPIEYVTVDYD
jgi:hypothetical protein